MSSDGLLVEELKTMEVKSPHLPGPVLLEATKFYALQAKNIKDDIDELAVELRQRQEKIRFLHDLIQEINSLTTDGSDLNLSPDPEIQEKLAAAAKMGVRIPTAPDSNPDNPTYKTTYSNIERDRLVENLHLTSDELDKDNKMAAQRITILIQESDRYVMLASQVMKYEQKAKQGATQGIK